MAVKIVHSFIKKMAGNTIPVPFNCPDELSTEEFQRKLYKWFVDRGLMSDLRAQLRFHIISSLQDTDYVSLPGNPIKQTLSPRLQAINLLVAEYLLRQNCMYSLSVFTSEIPFLQNMSEFITSIRHVVRERNGNNSAKLPSNGDSIRFQQRDIKDILQGIGILPDSDVGIRTFNLYQNSQESEALLLCIFEILPNLNNYLRENKSESRGEGTVPGNEENPRTGIQTSSPLRSVSQENETLGLQIRNCLLQTNLSNEELERVEYKIKRALRKEIAKNHQEEKAKYKEKVKEKEKKYGKEVKELEARNRDKLEIAMEEHQRDIAKRETEQNEKQSEREAEFKERQAEFDRLKAEQEAVTQHEMARRESALREQLFRREEDSQRSIHVAQRALAEERQNFEREVRSTRDSLRQKEEEIVDRLQRTEGIKQDLMYQLRRLQERNGIQDSTDSRASQVPPERRFNRLPDEAGHDRFPSGDVITLREGGLRSLDTTSTRIPNPNPRTRELATQHRKELFRMGTLQPNALESLVQDLQQQNTELRGETLQQRQRIGELTTQASDLTFHLASARGNPPQRPVPRRAGSRVERRPLSSSDDMSSATEEILADARSRLRSLEEESAAVDRSYQEFRLRQKLGGSATRHRQLLPHTEPSHLTARRSVVDVQPGISYESSTGSGVDVAGSSSLHAQAQWPSKSVRTLPSRKRTLGLQAIPTVTVNVGIGSQESINPQEANNLLNVHTDNSTSAATSQDSQLLETQVHFNITEVERPCDGQHVSHLPSPVQTQYYVGSTRPSSGSTHEHIDLESVRVTETASHNKSPEIPLRQDYDSMKPTTSAQSHHSDSKLPGTPQEQVHSESEPNELVQAAVDVAETSSRLQDTQGNGLHAEKHRELAKSHNASNANHQGLGEAMLTPASTANDRSLEVQETKDDSKDGGGHNPPPEKDVQTLARSYGDQEVLQKTNSETLIGDHMETPSGSSTASDQIISIGEVGPKDDGEDDFW